MFRGEIDASLHHLTSVAAGLVAAATGAALMLPGSASAATSAWSASVNSSDPFTYPQNQWVFTDDFAPSGTLPSGATDTTVY